MPLSASSRSCDHSSLMEPSLKRSSGPSRDPAGLAALPASHDTLETVVMFFKKARLFKFVSRRFSPSKVARSGTSIYLILEPGAMSEYLMGEEEQRAFGTSFWLCVLALFD